MSGRGLLEEVGRQGEEGGGDGDYGEGDGNAIPQSPR